MRTRALIQLAGAALLLLGCSQRLAGPMPEDPLKWSEDNPPADGRTWQAYAKLVCKPKVLDACSPDSCKSAKPAAFVVWKPRENIYERCDDNGCDSYPAQVAFSGSFTNITVPDQPLLFKVSTDRHYVEVVTLMDLTLVYRGSCAVE